MVGYDDEPDEEDDAEADELIPVMGDDHWHPHEDFLDEEEDNDGYVPVIPQSTFIPLSDDAQFLESQTGALTRYMVSQRKACIQHSIRIPKNHSIARKPVTPRVTATTQPSPPAKGKPTMNQPSQNITQFPPVPGFQGPFTDGLRNVYYVNIQTGRHVAGTDLMQALQNQQTQQPQYPQYPQQGQYPGAPPPPGYAHAHYQHPMPPQQGQGYRQPLPAGRNALNNIGGYNASEGDLYSNPNRGQGPNDTTQQTDVFLGGYNAPVEETPPLQNIKQAVAKDQPLGQGEYRVTDVTIDDFHRGIKAYSIAHYRDDCAVVRVIDMNNNVQKIIVPRSIEMNKQAHLSVWGNPDIVPMEVVVEDAKNTPPIINPGSDIQYTNKEYTAACIREAMVLAHAEALEHDKPVAALTTLDEVVAMVDESNEHIQALTQADDNVVATYLKHRTGLLNSGFPSVVYYIDQRLQVLVNDILTYGVGLTIRITGAYSDDREELDRLLKQKERYDGFHRMLTAYGNALFDFSVQEAGVNGKDRTILVNAEKASIVYLTTDELERTIEPGIVTPDRFPGIHNALAAFAEVRETQKLPLGYIYVGDYNGRAVRVLLSDASIPSMGFHAITKSIQ